jgi:vacuolar-type H+-ATPase subunit H
VSREDVLNRIRQAEAKRRSMGEEARRQKDRILADARKEVRRILDEAGEAAAGAAARKVQEETGRIQHERQLLVDSGDKQVALQREKSAARLPAAIDRICQEFLRSVHE